VSGELVCFARFEARPGREQELEQAIARVVTASRSEPGCLQIEAWRAINRAGRIYIHSRWRDEPAFEVHAVLPHTTEFLAGVRELITHDVDLTRTLRMV